MNIKFRSFVWLSSVVLGIFMVSNVYARPEGKSCFKGGEDGKTETKMESRFQRVFKELNLTPEQEERLKNHRAGSREEMKAFHKKMSDKRKELGDEIQKQELDMEKINQLNSELKAMHSEMQDNRLKDILEAREILTPEQFGKFREFIEKHGPGMKDNYMGKKHMKKRDDSVTQK